MKEIKPYTMNLVDTTFMLTFNSISPTTDSNITGDVLQTLITIAPWDFSYMHAAFTNPYQLILQAARNAGNKKSFTK